jgi:hypothetical protein
MEFEPDHALQRIHAKDLPDAAQPVVNTAPVQMQPGGDVLH